MSNIVFIGPQDLHALFKSVGMEVFDVKPGEKVEDLLSALVAKGAQVIYIVESFAQNALAPINEMMKRHAVSIVIMRDHKSNLGLGMALDKKAAIDAVGTDAIFNAGTGK